MDTTMSTEKEPDYAGIAKRLAKDFNKRLESERKMYPHASYPIAEGWALCMEARLRSDWETIKLLRALPHADDCAVYGEWKKGENPAIMHLEGGACSCGLSAHLSKLLEPFTP